MAINKLYCPPNVTLSDIWVNNGTSECFMDTVTTSVIFGFLFLFGSIQLGMYKKYGTEVATNHLPKSKLYALQIICTLLIPILEIIKFILQATLFDDREIYIYMVVTLAMTVFIYPYSIIIMHKERKYLLPSVPTRGHGIVLLIFWTLVFISENLLFINLGQKQWWFRLTSLKDEIEMALFVLRYISCLVIFVLGLRAPGIMQNVDYFSLNDSTNAMHINIGERSENQSVFANIRQRFTSVAPYLWPKNEYRIQLRIAFCFFLLVCGRIVNVYVPIYNKLIVDSMAMKPVQFRWDWVSIYVGFKFLQGGGIVGMGFFNNLRSFLWVKVQQFTARKVQVELFRHLHSLSLRWHLNRKSGEILRVMDRGTDSINNFLNSTLFQIVPTFVDIIIGVIYFLTSFNGWFGLIVFLTMVLYIGLTIIITEWRTRFQRKMNLAENAANARSIDSLLNFETVKYYGAEQFEVDSYRDVVLEYQALQWWSLTSINMLNTVQNIIISGGLLAGSLLCVHMVVEKERLSIGDYVLFASYIIQLYLPLNWLGTYYRGIQRNFVDMENMFDLLREEQDIIDAPGAEQINVKRGAIDFNNVSFGYTPERVILKNITFSVPPGKTIAFVGPSGSGKSTIIRLLFRFYDVNTGAILIDGQNIQTVTQESLRSAIGVVPQDTVLFNNTVMYNIRYGRIDATNDDVIEAAKGADIHDKILNFPEGYDTVVGERGLRLSGGEKQRVAIARTLLKSPTIILLDEATSALDTQTERNIQMAINSAFCNKTTLIVAHRLSTIIHADEILVLCEGEIVERGKHEELVGYGGIYAEMWRQQLSNNEGNQSGRQISGEYL